MAAEIESRLRAAGYGIVPVRLGPAQGAPPAFHGVVSAASIVTPAAPGEQQAFRVQVAFACTCSFDVTISVFRSSVDASRYETTAARAAANDLEQRCAYTPGCRRHPRTYEQAHRDATRERTVGTIEYEASTNDGVSIVPLRDFNQVVALASGH